MVSKSSGRKGRRPSVLVVCEPNSPMQRAMGALKEEGYAVQHTVSTYRAVVDQSRRPSEIVLVDTTPLLERDLEVFEVIRSLSPRPFLVASFPASAREKARLALERGADAYVLEPFEPEEITLLLERSRERRAAPEVDEPLGQRLASLGRFSAGVAHEINNPLTTISGWIQLALADMHEEDPGRRTFETMQEEVDRIATIVRNLLSFAGEPPVEEEPVNLNDVLVEVLADVGSDGVGVNRSFDEALPLILANREQIRRACEQVVKNALKSMNGRGELSVTTRSMDNEDMVAVEVSDDGCGIPESVLARIFDPFFSNANGGTGLGLSAAYGIIRGHGGRIEVTSREREGTRFTIRLPLHRLRTRNRILEYA